MTKKINRYHRHRFNFPEDLYVFFEVSISYYLMHNKRRNTAAENSDTIITMKRSLRNYA